MAIALSETGYCTAADVAMLIQQLTIDSTSDPSTAEVESFITDDFHMINGMLAAQNIAVPVSQSGGSLSVASGNITTNKAHTMGDRDVELTGSSLAGSVRYGDMLSFAGATQKYMANMPAEATDDNTIAVPIAPSLETDIASGTVVTYTSAAGAANVLMRLNALGAAVLTMMAAYGSAGGELGEDYDALLAQRTTMWTNVQAQQIKLLGVDRDVAKGPSSESIPLIRY